MAQKKAMDNQSSVWGKTIQWCVCKVTRYQGWLITKLLLHATDCMTKLGNTEDETGP